MAGAVDAHCTSAQSIGSCTPPDDVTVPDTASDYGPTLFNAAGDDDDCKYHVVWTSTPIHKNEQLTFTVTVTNKTDGSPTIGAAPFLEAFIGDHCPPGGTQTPTGTSAGSYTISGLVLDQSGVWTVRFHLFESCVDWGAASPHGHAAFFVKVP